MLKCNSTEVDKDASFVSAPEDIVLDVGSLFRDSECDKGFIHGCIDDDAYNMQNRFGDKKHSCSIGHDHLKISADPVANIIHDGEDKSTKFLYEMSNETDSEVFQGNRFSSIYEDALLDVKPAHALFDSYYGPDGASCLSNDDFGSHYAGLKEKDLGVFPRTCPGSGVKVESRNNNDSSLLDQMKDQGLHEAFRNIIGHETTAEDKQWLKNCILFGIKNRVELGSLVKQLECSEYSSRDDSIPVISSAVECSVSAPDSSKREWEKGNNSEDNENKEGSISFVAEKTLATDNCAVGAGSLHSGGIEGGATQKRMRKPTKRYLEHSLELKARCFNRKCKVFNDGSKSNGLQGKLRKQNHQKEAGEASLVSAEKSFDGGFIQVPFGSPVDDAHPKKVSTSGKKDMEVQRKDRQMNPIKKNYVKCSSSETAQVPSEDMCQASNKNQIGKIRRKHHIMWSLSEVMKLVEGVSKYGVGKWTEIKRLMFPSSSRRTSVDIKDKWRNLLKASGMKLHGKGKVHYGQKQASHQVPESVLCRVRELAGMHPYPKEQKTKMSASR